MYATSNQLTVVLLLGGVTALVLAALGDSKDRSLRTDVNSLQYKTNQLYKHRHYIDANDTTSSPPIRAVGVRAPSGTNTNYLSGAWFS